MILLNVTTKDKGQAVEIADFLVSKRLILDALVTEGTKYKRSENNDIIAEQHFLILGKTKALLFGQIDEILKEKYGSNMPTIYSVPIINMDWDQSSELIEKTEKV
ncbi:divalent cation tolerance protein CutA [Fulvivirgaceae bacterium BMA10]|uniref:Divalent cation tolerance protein CutA n=1 Tax=Splendidivirga corallicola TaxID=3051826 RepID=A0ABT8KTS2_9BACT|nr:divalent cation tolerance protein CutA [Fulvivirgaceae bacterium BMA10]